MNSLNTTPAHEERAQRVAVTEDSLVIGLIDGRNISAPLVRYPRLLNGASRERNNWRLIAGGEGIHWPDLDEDLSVDSLIAGRPSGESPQSLKRWLERRRYRPDQAGMEKFRRKLQEQLKSHQVKTSDGAPTEPM